MNRFAALLESILPLPNSLSSSSKYCFAAVEDKTAQVALAEIGATCVFPRCSDMRSKTQPKIAIVEMRRVIDNASLAEFFVESFAQLGTTRYCDCSFTE